MAGRENLSSRFRRVLGRSPVDDLSESPSDSLDATGSTTRRRGQVLNAQRTHRKRTQQYIRELEREVFRLRDENEDLRKLVSRLGGAVPDERSRAVPDEGQLASGNRGRPRQSQGRPSETRVSVDLTGLAGTTPSDVHEGHASGKVRMEAPVYHPSPSTAPQLPPISEYQQQQDQTDSPITAQTGIDFILALESPCLPHIAHLHEIYASNPNPTSNLPPRSPIPTEIPYNIGAGHLLNASATLVHRYHDRNLEDSALHLSNEEIERLLEASGHLRLDNEVTPVQIWARIKEMVDDSGSVHPRISRSGVEALKKELSLYVYCNSFGAVVQKSTVDAILARIPNPRQ